VIDISNTVSFPTLDTPTPSNESSRILPQDVISRTLTQSTLSSEVLGETAVDILGPFNVVNGGTITLMSTHTNTPISTPIGVLPYMVAFFQGSLATANMINAAINSGYAIMGPLAAPNFTPHAVPGVSIGGSDGKDVVFYTTIQNNTGGNKNIYILTNARVFTPIGGATLVK
jgi:hypothetical protein